MHLHPLSPAETDPTQARAKRQAYQVQQKARMIVKNNYRFTLMEILQYL